MCACAYVCVCVCVCVCVRVQFGALYNINSATHCYVDQHVSYVAIQWRGGGVERVGGCAKSKEITGRAKVPVGQHMAQNIYKR